MFNGFISTQGVISIIVLALLIFLTLVIMPKMMRKLTGTLTDEQLTELKERDALVLDVRTRDEFGHGKAKGSLNIPWDELPNRLNELDRTRPILVCCASGVRSAKAKAILDEAGFPEVYNAGYWMNVK